MGNSGKQAHDFYNDVINHNKIWTIQYSNEVVTFISPRGIRTLPFWSKITRIQKIIKTTPEYSKFLPLEISWDEFENELAPKLKEKNIFVGINWSGRKITGYDMPASQLIEIVKVNKEASSKKNL